MSILRTCVVCGRDLSRSSFTANQWAKGSGNSRCAACVHGHRSDTPSSRPSNSGRHNLSNRASFDPWDLAHPFASGSFRWVAEGKYTDGPRRGQPCVAKWFKSGTVFEKDYFTLDIKAIDKALELVNRFNDLRIINKDIKINVAQVWTFTRNSPEDWAGAKVLQEPFIEDYQKFNSNSGWYDDTHSWGQVMQALSHFSYHVSGGFYVLCDLQGGVYQREVVLSDPVILSRRGEFGVTDLGPEGISSFFYQHECSGYCRPHWTRPSNPVQHYRPIMGTSMIRRNVPTRHSRPEHHSYYM
jgi:hypothetical protein